ncbi:unnamed protein product [[Candida] boidinii]|nr:hypothetical protein B5S27_g3572 [[Candida] boidinii]OWB65954.1 hypothetical protein B5S30_g1288 [[Candida] boidinii]GMF10321.1 unnamed protein product [[Candida] boidinii]
MATGSSIAMETVFADKFQTLIEFVCPEKTYDDNYQKLLSPKEINQFGFPKIDNTPIFKRSNNTESDSLTSRKITIKLKSLRPPKFNTDLVSDSNDLILNIKQNLKEFLITNVNTIVEVSQIKLMLKTKTISDSTKISELLTTSDDGEEQNEVSLNVMIMKLDSSPSPIPANADTATTTLQTEVKSAEPAFSGLTESSWSKIYDILKSEIKDEQVLENYFNNLKNVNY